MWLRAEDGFVVVKTIFESIRKIIDSELFIYLELVKPCGEHLMHVVNTKNLSIIYIVSPNTNSHSRILKFSDWLKATQRMKVVENHI